MTDRQTTHPVIIGNATLYHGDCLGVLAGLPDASIDLTVLNKIREA